MSHLASVKTALEQAMGQTDVGTDGDYQLAGLINLTGGILDSVEFDIEDQISVFEHALEVMKAFNVTSEAKAAAELQIKLCRNSL